MLGYGGPPAASIEAGVRALAAIARRHRRA
jgi:hypothetical protein